MSSGFLKNTPPKVPFEVPDGYFEELHGRIMARTRQEGEQASALPHRTADTAAPLFTTPPGYFESLPARISRRISIDAGETGNRTAANPPVLRPADRYKIAAAACITLLLGVLGILQVAQKRDSREPVTSVMNFDQEILIQEYLRGYDPEAAEAAEVEATEAEAADAEATEADEPGELEIYLLNQVEEGMLLQEL